jgi:predicted RNase H-like HicB family nuclease/uncharacterized damage-inducible protein DinB
MTTYGLHLESGPKRRKTMVHVPQLLGCVAVGPTTEDALAATPEAIRDWLRLLRRHGEPVDPDEIFATEVVEHVTEGEWLGNGSPYIVLASDLVPLSDAEAAEAMRRFAWMREELATWVEGRTDADLDAAPAEGGRSARAIVLHLLTVPGPYLSPVLGGAPGFSALQTAAERGAVSIPDALRRVVPMVDGLVATATPTQRTAVIERPKDVRTFTKAIRRILEHDWEHRAELARRPDGPTIRGTPSRPA